METPYKKPVTWEQFSRYWQVVFGVTERQARITWLSIQNKWRREGRMETKSWQQKEAERYEKKLEDRRKLDEWYEASIRATYKHVDGVWGQEIPGFYSLPPATPIAEVSVTFFDDGHQFVSGASENLDKVKWVSEKLQEEQ